jgi:hypothetical protein
MVIKACDAMELVFLAIQPLRGLYLLLFVRLLVSLSLSFDGQRFLCFFFFHMSSSRPLFCVRFQPDWLLKLISGCNKKHEEFSNVLNLRLHKRVLKKRGGKSARLAHGCSECVQCYVKSLRQFVCRHDNGVSFVLVCRTARFLCDQSGIALPERNSLQEVEHAELFFRE